MAIAERTWKIAFNFHIQAVYFAHAAVFTGHTISDRNPTLSTSSRCHLLVDSAFQGLDLSGS